jgi:hypothetical protein
MKNAVAVMALLISVGGIFVSLAREEMRCYLGLTDDCRVRGKTIAPNTRKPTGEPEKQEVVPTAQPTPMSDRKPEPKAAPQLSTEPTKSQPLEVIPPPPEAANKSEGQPIEVIPPPEDPHE